MEILGTGYIEVRYTQEEIIEQFTTSTCIPWVELEFDDDNIELGCEHEICEGDALGLFVSECKDSVNFDLSCICDRLLKAEEILESIWIDEEPQIINILHVDY